MALADTITNLGNSIIALVGTRAKKDLSNIDEAGVEKIKSYAGGGGSNPVGTVIAYMGRTVPDGYLLMDGREVSKETYADLYAVVGDTMGTATDPTKFVIANMTDGRYLMGSTVAGARVAQAVPTKTWKVTARSLVSNDGGTALTAPASNMSSENYTWSGTHAAMNYSSINNPICRTYTWTYGSGEINRPLSINALMCIKY